MGSQNLRLEDYPAIVDFILNSFERDLSEFTIKYKTMNADYLSQARSASSSLKALIATKTAIQQQKDITKALYSEADALKGDILLLKDYAQRGNVPVILLGDCIYMLSNKNVEGALHALRGGLPYFSDNSSKMADMPDGFLDQVANRMAEIDNLNAEQNKALNASISTTATLQKSYQEVYKYISEISKAGKLIYAKSPKADEYTISKLLARVRAATKTTPAAKEAKTSQQ